MKIGFDAKRAFRNYSGLGNYSRRIITQLCNFYPNNEYYLFTPVGKIRASGIKNFPPEKVTVITPRSLSSKIFNSYWRTMNMGSAISREGIDLFHGLSNELPVNITQRNHKSLVTIHDLIFIRYPNLYKPIDRYIYHKKFSFSCSRSDKIIAISKQTKQDVVNFFHVDEKKIDVVYQTCHPDFMEKVSEEQKNQIRRKYNLPSNYILYVGTIEERKNLLNLVKAIHYGNIDVPLVIIGKERAYARQVFEFIQTNKVRNIIFLKIVPSEDLPSIYQMSDVFVYPSSFEGFGIPVLEGINSGIPVIAGKGSCLEETGGPDTIYVDPSDISEISDSISRVLSDNALRTKMIKKGLEFAQNFTEKKTINSLYKVYESLL